jgi:hypothetical protein
VSWLGDVKRERPGRREGKKERRKALRKHGSVEGRKEKKEEKTRTVQRIDPKENPTTCPEVVDSGTRRGGLHVSKYPYLHPTGMV